MPQSRFVSAGIVGLVGYLLSPLSPWNDAFLNIPLAYACAWLVSLAYRPAFLPALIIAYWITNIVGLILLHKGAVKALQKRGERAAYGKGAFMKDIVWSLVYTALISLLVKLGLLRPPGEYF